MNPKTIRLWSAGVALASGILAIGNEIKNIPGLPGWLVNSWPVVLIVAVLFNNVAQAFMPPKQ